MRRLARVGCLVAAAILLTSCLRPPITRRYQKQTHTMAPVGEIEAALGAFSLPIPAVTAKTTLLSLSERGQASLIRELGNQSDSSDSLLTALGSSIGQDSKPDRDIDLTHWSRRVVFSLENRSEGPADRMSAARIRLDQLTGGASFESWTQFATKYDSVDLGTLRLTEHRELGAEAGAPGAVKAGLSGRVSQDREENLKLSQRYVSLTGSLSPDAAELIEQGAPGLDLTGNVAVDLTLKADTTKQTDVFRFGSLWDDKRQPKKPGDIQIFRQAVHFPASTRDIVARASLTATLRKVLRGDRTLVESDDLVEFRTGTTQARNVVLVTVAAQIVNVWVLRHPSGTILHFERPGTVPEPVQLGSFDAAVALKEYLVKAAQPESIGGRTLLLPPSATPLDPAHAAVLQVEIVPMNQPH